MVNCSNLNEKKFEVVMLVVWNKQNERIKQVK